MKRNKIILIIFFLFIFNLNNICYAQNDLYNKKISNFFEFLNISKIDNNEKFNNIPIMFSVSDIDKTSKTWKDLFGIKSYKISPPPPLPVPAFPVSVEDEDDQENNFDNQDDNEDRFDSISKNETIQEKISRIREKIYDLKEKINFLINLKFAKESGFFNNKDEIIIDYYGKSARQTDKTNVTKIVKDRYRYGLFYNIIDEIDKLKECENYDLVKINSDITDFYLENNFEKANSVSEILNKNKKLNLCEKEIVVIENNKKKNYNEAEKEILKLILKFNSNFVKEDNENTIINIGFISENNIKIIKKLLKNEKFLKEYNAILDKYNISNSKENFLDKAMLIKDEIYVLKNGKLEEVKEKRKKAVLPVDLYFGFASEGSRTEESEKIFVGVKDKSVNEFNFQVSTVEKIINIPFFNFYYKFLIGVDDNKNSEIYFSKKNNENEISFYLEGYSDSLNGEIQFDQLSNRSVFGYPASNEKNNQIIKNKKFKTIVTQVSPNVYKHTMKLKFTNEEIDKIIEEMKKEGGNSYDKKYSSYVYINLDYRKDIGSKVLYLNYLSLKLNFEE